LIKPIIHAEVRFWKLWVYDLFHFKNLCGRTFNPTL
jgi:hypothetical protein